MLPEKIYAESWEADARLVPFRVTRAELIEARRRPWRRGPIPSTLT
jgi:hypothetical protein